MRQVLQKVGPKVQLVHYATRHTKHWPLESVVLVGHAAKQVFGSKNFK